MHVRDMCRCAPAGLPQEGPGQQEAVPAGQRGLAWASPATAWRSITSLGYSLERNFHTWGAVPVIA